MGRLVRACDVTREIQQQQRQKKSNTATVGSTTLEDMLASSGYWLRLLVVRKGFAPPLRGPSYFAATSGGGVGAKNSISNSNGNHSKVKGVTGGRGGKSGGRGGKGAKVPKAGRGRGPRGRGKSSQPVRVKD